MPGYIYDLNSGEQYTPQQGAYGTIAKLAGQFALQGSAFYMMESNLSMMGITPLGYTINFDKPKLLGRLNKFTYEHMYSKIPTGWGKSYQQGTAKIAELTGTSLPTIKGSNLDQGWMKFNPEVHNAYSYIEKQMKGLGYKDYDQFQRQYKGMKDTDTLKLGTNQVTKQEAKNIMQQWKWSSVFSGITGQLEALQTYQMWDRGLTIAETVGTQISDSYKNKQTMKYYRRLQGISGSVSAQHQNDLSYSRQEEQLIMRAVNNQMVTRQIVNDQGVFGANPYQQIYG